MPNLPYDDHINKEKRYFHCYVTANDKRLYLQDICNLIKIKNTPSGYLKTYLYVAISKVKTLNILDKIFVFIVKILFHNHKNISLKKILFKENKGRDFSSYSILNQKILKVALDSDYVFFQNRSAYGPYQKNWLQFFVNQYEKFYSIAICGSTINFNCYQYSENNEMLAHVQTYAFLIQVTYLKMLGQTFPAENEINRMKIIQKGEIDLSQFFLKRNYRITCLEWNNNAFGYRCSPISNIDVKEHVQKKHPFYHRSYFKKKRKIKNKLIKPFIIYISLMIFYLFTIFKKIMKRFNFGIKK